MHAGGQPSKLSEYPSPVERDSSTAPAAPDAPRPSSLAVEMRANRRSTQAKTLAATTGSRNEEWMPQMIPENPTMAPTVRLMYEASSFWSAGEAPTAPTPLRMIILCRTSLRVSSRDMRSAMPNISTAALTSLESTFAANATQHAGGVVAPTRPLRETDGGRKTGSDIVRMPTASTAIAALITAARDSGARISAASRCESSVDKPTVSDPRPRSSRMSLACDGLGGWAIGCSPTPGVPTERRMSGRWTPSLSSEDDPP